MAGIASTSDLRAADRIRLSFLNAQIEQLQVALNMLCSERQLVNDRLDAYTYPVLTLPNEIVSEIFIQYIPPYPSCPPLLGDGSPTKLGQICRHWREIAHATPALWRAIELFVPESSAHFSRVVLSQLTAAQTWLQRSRTLPLSITMESHASIPPGDYAKTLDDLLAHRTRWEYVGLRLADEVDFDAHRPRLEGSMPLLLELDLHFEDISWLGTMIGSLHVPRLSTVCLDFCELQNIEHLQELLPWSQLTSMVLQYVDTNTAAIILRETSNLVHCRMTLDAVANLLNTPPLQLPELETLVVQSARTLYESEDTYNLLLSLRAPLLKRLYIAEYLIPLYHDVDNLVFVIRAFGCKLDRLCISEADVSLETYKVALPEVAHLELVPARDSSYVNWGPWCLLTRGT
ncbi:hypothetical protein C8F01DRAFT_1098979 [Mycena amicta]|nr:hypothetical protein C8F01DRAFT_1098979 [Mycena amicta]